MKPVARKNGLVVRDLADEVVIYDKERHEAHCLNGTAATVFRNADGRRSVSDIAVLLSAGGGPGAEELVQMALGQLGEARLLESGPSFALEPGLPRRDAMRRVGLAAAVLLPLVTSILAPTPSEAAATCVAPGGCGGQPNGTACNCLLPADCLVNCTCVGGVCDGPSCTGGPC